jgi:hypothetical protein
MREGLLLCSSYLLLGVPNWAVIYTPSSNFSGAVAREKEDFCKGSLSLPILVARGWECLLPYLPGNDARKGLDVYARFYSCRQCWASKCRGL